MAICVCPGSKHDLARVYLKPGDTLRSIIRRFSVVRNTIANIAEVEVITAFTMGIHDCDLRAKFNRKPPSTIEEMLKRANEYADAEEAEIR